MTGPTDAELIALLGDRQFSTIGAVREALRRWGTPPAGAGEPVASKGTSMAYDNDYPTEPIGGGNQYCRCVHCKRSMTEINGNLQKHESWRPYRLMKEGDWHDTE